MTGLRPELLSGRTVVVIGEGPAMLRALAELGARVEHGPTESASALVFDAAGPFAQGGHGGLGAATAAAWTAIREVAAEGLIAQKRPGKIVLIAPRPDAGPFATAARAALENLARTLSVEWARYGITATAIAPDRKTTDAQVAELVCFLVSPAGDYFSGCRFSLGVAAPAG